MKRLFWCLTTKYPPPQNPSKERKYHANSYPPFSQYPPLNITVTSKPNPQYCWWCWRSWVACYENEPVCCQRSIVTAAEEKWLIERKWCEKTSKSAEDWRIIENSLLRSFIFVADVPELLYGVVVVFEDEQEMVVEGAKFWFSELGLISHNEKVTYLANITNQKKGSQSKKFINQHPTFSSSSTINALL